MNNNVGTTPTSIFLTPGTGAGASTDIPATVGVLQILPTLTPAPALSPSAMPTATPTPAAPLVQVALTSFLNNTGMGTRPGQANFDGSGYSYPSSQLPAGGLITVQNIQYQFPVHGLGTNDNVIAAGQTIPLPAGKYHQLFLLVASTWGPVTGVLTIRYTTGSAVLDTLNVLDWYAGSGNGLATTQRYTPSGVEKHPAYIYVMSLTLDATRTVNSLLLPATLTAPHSYSHIHLFALTLVR